MNHVSEESARAVVGHELPILLEVGHHHLEPRGHPLGGAEVELEHVAFTVKVFQKLRLDLTARHDLLLLRKLHESCIYSLISLSSIFKN